ncbi:MAG TPA: 50S ribosomal protein L13 [Saprospiraceae bacterium]|nr:50S ribosomal protein L13 [Saprospiraceae bacterium]
MNSLSYKTRSVSKEEVTRRWFVIDAENQVLGRLCTKVATVLRGKHHPEYTPHVDTGDFVIVINADKVRFTGNKENTKRYQQYSGYPGGQKELSVAQMRARKPERIVEIGVKGMLPKNKLGNAMFKKLFVYTGSEHPHAAQKPETLA